MPDLAGTFMQECMNMLTAEEDWKLSELNLLLPIKAHIYELLGPLPEQGLRALAAMREGGGSKIELEDNDENAMMVVEERA